MEDRVSWRDAVGFWVWVIVVGGISLGGAVNWIEGKIGQHQARQGKGCWACYETAPGDAHCTPIPCSAEPGKTGSKEDAHDMLAMRAHV